MRSGSMPWAARADRSCGISSSRSQGSPAWTSAEVARVAVGDADAVSVGDFHLKHLIAHALAGEPRGTDEHMLELLEPFAGHRGRVCVLIESAGITAPRYGPRARIEPLAQR